MELSALVALQITADERRGFRVAAASERERHLQMANELVGLVGEIGEFANLLKKVGLGITHPRYVGPSLADAAPHLREELVDTVIYVFRLMTMLEGDLEQEILEKMKANNDRYAALEK